MRLHPEKILVSVVGLSLLIGGSLAVSGFATGHRGLVRAGFIVFLVGGAISFLPLIGLGCVLFYERFIRRTKK